MIASSTCPLHVSCLLTQWLSGVEFMLSSWFGYKFYLFYTFPSLSIHLWMFLSFLESLSDNHFQHGVFNLSTATWILRILSLNKCLYFYVGSLKLNSAIVDYFLTPEAFSYLNTLLIQLRNMLCGASSFFYPPFVPKSDGLMSKLIEMYRLGIIFSFCTSGFIWRQIYH